MVTVRLYVEGAPQKNDLKRERCREAFSTFPHAGELLQRLRSL